ncbi:hypothetical protein DFH06DRAFT_1135394 [Mycena polygramma]|nr:hypothetical protein DFH06DRAFT_1135394 [Mycena polygramma]
MSSEELSPDASSPETLQSYDVATTSVLYGLTSAQQQEVLRKYRMGWQRENGFAEPVLRYDLTCQYYKNVRAMEQRGSHTDSDEDEDSIISDSDSSHPSMPPLQSTAASTTDSPSPGTLSQPAFPLPAEWLSSPAGSAPPASTGLTDGEGVERAWAFQGRIDGKEGLPNGTAAAVHDAEGIERAWADSAGAASTREMNAGSRHANLNVEMNDFNSTVHDIRIITRGAARDVKCDCVDGAHATHAYRSAHAFLDADDNLVLVATPLKLSFCGSVLACMSSPVRASQSSSTQSSPSYRAPNRSQTADLSFEYERRPDDFSHDKGFFVSGDGRRATTREFNVQKRRKVRPSDLPDAFGEWMPLPEGPEDNVEGEEDEGAGTGDKRKRDVSGGL